VQRRSLTNLSYILFGVLATMLVGYAGSETPLETKIKVKPWFVKEFEPHKIIGNLFYVGGYDLASFLITSDEGHILVNTGMVGTEAQLI
jgi:hypothetical protein